MYRVWKAPATSRGRSRALAGGAAAKACRSVIRPAATICPAVLTFAGVRPCLARAASASSWSPPSTAVIPVGSAAEASAIAVARTRTSRSASSALITPAMTPAASSPTLCPAVASAGRSLASPPARAPAATRAAATSRGWATAVSLISSALAVVPYLMRSQPASSEAAPSRSATPGSSSQGARKPGVCAPCPGAVMISILPPCPVEVRQLNAGDYEVAHRKLVASIQIAFTQMSSSRYSAALSLRGARRRRLPSSLVPRSSVQAVRRPFGSRSVEVVPRSFGAPGGQSAQDDGDPQGEAVTADRRRVRGEFGDAAQPVTDRVRGDEQQPRGGLQGRALLQVGRQGFEQRVPAADQRLVNVADQGGSGVLVAVQGAFGQQFVGPRRGGGGAQIPDQRAGDDRSWPEPAGETLGRGDRVLGAAEHQDQPVSLHAGEEVEPGALGLSPEVLDERLRSGAPRALGAG